MNKLWLSFGLGVLLTAGAAVFFFSQTGSLPAADPVAPGQSGAQAQRTDLRADSVTIRPLAPLRLVSGTNVPFEGRTELPQVIAGRYARGVDIIRFQATGENAHKSYVRVIWEDGTEERIPAGATDHRFAPDRRARQISIVGYSVHERRIFRDSGRKGSLTWEIRFEPVE